MRTADLRRVLAQREDIVAAAVVALEAGSVGSPGQMSRRWQLLGLDARRDLPAVAVARRGKRTGLVIEAHCFRRHDGAWVWEEMGPTWNYTQPTLPPRAASACGGPSDATTHNNARPGDDVGLWHLAAPAARIRTDGRTRAVPPHGWVVTVDPAAARPTEVLDADDRVIGHLEIDENLSIPRRFRVAMWWNRWRRTDAGQWFNYAPDERAR